MHSVEPSSVTRRVWPNGWSWNPIRFVFSTANLKSLAHAFVLAVLCGPMALLSLLGLVLIGGVGSTSDDMWRGMA
ncbi:two-component sensor histidine kinase, partial [Cutibacterium acnes subsp. acnes]|nr:two-component sensor histidine kinase [Cutibacterium acnes subsp. acnes]